MNTTFEQMMIDIEKEQQDMLDRVSNDLDDLQDWENKQSLMWSIGRVFTNVEDGLLWTQDVSGKNGAWL